MNKVTKKAKAKSVIEMPVVNPFAADIGTSKKNIFHSGSFEA